MLIALVLCCVTLVGAELQKRTAEAFDVYVRLTERRITGELADHARFLWIDALPEPTRRARVDALRRGDVLIERLTTTDSGKQLDVPDALVHHWVGLVFVPSATVDQTVALMQDYNRHAEIFRPAVAQSKLLEREGDRFRVFLRFHMKKLSITAVLNTENEARFTRPGRDRAYSFIRSTRVAQVDQPGTSSEREKPVGQDDGYLWRLNTYWRFLERDGGTYIQCESVSLSRDVPFGFGWLIKPFVTSIPRESLEFTLGRVRETLKAEPKAAARVG